MLTPRRTFLLLAGFALFGGLYFAYARLLGWLDGLPQLPAKYLVQATGTFAPPERTTSPTKQKLIEAFGPESPETNYSHYPTQLEFRNGEKSVVLAAGKIPPNPNSTRVPLSPFSIAIFSKPRPAHLRQPGEVVEITTIHADRAVLEFDRVITDPTEMKKAKVVRLELVSDFAEALPDPRRGKVHITSNQKSSDPDRMLVLRTEGPVFYRDPKAAAGTPAAQGPDIWTDEFVEIVDRQNLPRPFGASAPLTAMSRQPRKKPAGGQGNEKSDEKLTSGDIDKVLRGDRLPPPTLTAVGLRVYMEPDPPPGQKRPDPKPGAIAGVRRIELLEQVCLNVWIDNGQSIVGAPPQPADPNRPAGPRNPLALVPPPAASAAVTGALGPVAYNLRLANRALLQVETSGPFSYESDKAVARFDVVPNSDPNVPNDVRVTKVPPKGGNTSLFSQILELEFNGGATAAARAPGAPAVNRIHAWTTAPGRVLTLVSDDEQARAHGTDLVHDHKESRTILTGAPLHVFRERNVLTAGVAQKPATLTTEPGPPMPGPIPGQPPVRKQQVTVRGAGKVEMYDATDSKKTLTASWTTSLVQSKLIDEAGREQDLFVLTDDAKFEDIKADYWLTGRILKVHLEPRDEKPRSDDKTAAKAGGGSPKPSRVLAIGQVKSHSSEYDIDDADQLTVHIKDGRPTPAAVAVAPKPPESPAAPKVAPAPPVAVPAPKPPEPVAVAKEPEKRKPPFKIKARTIETFVTRFEVPPGAAAPKPGDSPTSSGKYQLDRARCEDNVSVHQAPADPTKPRGVDIVGRLLLIDGSPDGNRMTVFGWAERPGEVHQEDMSLLGPEVILDQLRNAAAVKGRGSLAMPTKSDLAGTELNKPEMVVIHWRDAMAFNGAARSAEFVGKVTAQQGESSVQCHTMSVVFDRPMYFSPAQRRNPPPGAAVAGAPGDKAKIDKVNCYAAPADAADDRRELVVLFNQVEYDKDGKLIKIQHLRAQELRVEAQAQEHPGGEKFQRVIADGSGVLRVWQKGDAEVDGPARPAASAPVPKDKKTDARKKDDEMRLTIVEFSDRMTAVDKGRRLRQSTFTDGVKVISVPADTPNAAVNRNNPPAGAIMLTCSKELIVWSHRKDDGPATQRMRATGNAYVRSDDYDGSAPVITSEGKTVTLEGTEVIPARITGRFGAGSDLAGKKIVYDRGTGAANVAEGFGGTLTQPPKK